MSKLNAMSIIGSVNKPANETPSMAMYPAKANPNISSVPGYVQPILFPHDLHFPRSSNQPATGVK